MPRYRIVRMFALGTPPTPIPWDKIFSAPIYGGKISPTTPDGFGTATEIEIETDEATIAVLLDDRRDIDFAKPPT